MFVKTTRYQLKKDSMAKFRELSESARGRVASLDGLLYDFVAMDDTGRAVVVGVWESSEKARDSTQTVKAIWADVMEHVEGQLEMDEYPNALQLKGS